MLKRLILSWSITFSIFALEKISCPDSLSDSVSHAIFDSNIGSYDCHYFSKVIKNINNINEFSPVKPTINIILTHKSFSASFDQGLNLDIPQIFIRKNDKGNYHYLTKNQTAAIVAHEYGHAILSYYLEQEMPEYSDFFKLQKSISDLKMNAFLIRLKILDSQTRPQERVQLQKELFNFASKIMEFKKRRNNKRYKVFHEIMLPYQELLADTIAVYQYEDKALLTKIVNHPEYTEIEKELVLARSFNKNNISLSPNNINSEHAKLYLVRQYIGSKMWPKNKSEKLLYIEKLLSSIKHSIEEELHFKDTKSETNKEKSHRLILKLE